MFNAFSIRHVKAQEDFSTSKFVTYDVQNSGKTIVSYNITLTNLSSTIHAISYSFTLKGASAENISVFEDRRQIPFSIENNFDTTTIKISFDNAVVGKGKARTFTMQYEDKTVAVQNGQVWEINIPKIQDNKQYKLFELKLLVPQSFGNPAYIAPKPLRQETEQDKRFFMYSYDQLVQAGVVAAFGEFQTFDLNLTYHLKNPLKVRGITQIALPPDTAYQRMYYKAITPRPKEIELDEDGNWLGVYELAPDEQIDVNVMASAQIFATAQDFYPNQIIDPDKYLREDQYWEINDPQIQSLGKKLKTPRAIYEYVVNTLTYDYSRLKETIPRLGARGALGNPRSAICMEFTDLFVALSRAAGIPAREVNGFAYTQNPELQPLSLVADVLHAWPEYWDEEQKIWHPVDPTWENTTGGVDYFSTFDLSHITFAVHGQNSSSPAPAGSYKLAENPQKDVVVFFGDMPEKKPQALSMEVRTNTKKLPLSEFLGEMLFKNNGPTALYKLKPTVSHSIGLFNQKTPSINFIAPFDTARVAFKWETGPLFLLANHLPSLKIVADNTLISYTVPRETIIWELASIFAMLLGFAIVVMAILIGRKYAKSKRNNIKAS